jgi:hypothetical protein
VAARGKSKGGGSRMLSQPCLWPSGAARGAEAELKPAAASVRPARSIADSAFGGRGAQPPPGGSAARGEGEGEGEGGGGLRRLS